MVEPTILSAVIESLFQWWCLNLFCESLESFKISCSFSQSRSCNYFTGLENRHCAFKQEETIYPSGPPEFNTFECGPRVHSWILFWVLYLQYVSCSILFMLLRLLCLSTWHFFLAFGLPTHSSNTRIYRWFVFLSYL